MNVVWSIAGIVSLVSLLPGVVSSQDIPELLRTHGDLDVETLVDVRAADVRSEGVAVATQPTPAVHLFTAGGYDSWGREGGGPGEFSSPVDLVWLDGAVMVLDGNHRKIVTFGDDGTFSTTRPLDGWANRMFVVGTDTILGSFTPMTRSRAIVRYAGEARDTVLAYSTSPEEVRLEAPGAPSYTVAPPFTAQPEWTVLPDGLVALWRPGAADIQLLDLDGVERARIPGVGARLPVRDEDREIWFRDAIPQDFMGRRVFEPIRQRAREVMEFPERFPAVLELMGDPEGGVWVRKSTAGTGQVWHLLARDGRELGSLRFPPGRRLLAAGETELAVWSQDELGVERVEVYRRPGWAGRG